MNTLASLRTSQSLRQWSTWVMPAVVATVAVVVATLLFPHWYTVSPNLIDPWLYWGTAYAPDYSASAFATTYYFRRWTLVLPTYLASQFLSPLSTQVVVQGLTFALTVFLLLRALRGLAVGTSRADGQWLASVGLAFAASGFFAVNMGTTLHEGIGTLLFVAIISLCARPREHFRIGEAFFAGLVVVLLFVTYQFTAFFLPALVWMYASATDGASFRQWLGSLRIISALCGVAAGGLLDTLVGRLLVGGGWDGLLSYSFEMHRALPNAWGYPRSVWIDALSEWSGAVVVLGAAAIAALFLVEGRRSRWAITLALMSIPFVYDFVRSGGSLFWTHTSIYFYVAVFLAVALLARHAFAFAWSPLVLVGLVVTARFLTLAPQRALLLSAALTVTAAALRPSSTIVKRGASLAALALLMSGLAMHPWTKTPSWDTARGEPSSFYERLTEDHTFVTEWATSTETRVLIIDARPHVGWSTNVSALYGGYSALVLGYDSAIICDWGPSVALPTVAVAIVGDFTAMPSQQDELPPAVAGFRAVETEMGGLRHELEAILLDRALSDCGGIDVGGRRLSLLQVRPKGASKDEIAIYGYR